jgi:hypothetical protein
MPFDPNDPAIYANLFGLGPVVDAAQSVIPDELPTQPEFTPAEPFTALGGQELGIAPPEVVIGAAAEPEVDPRLPSELARQSRSVSTSRTDPVVVQLETGALSDKPEVQRRVQPEVDLAREELKESAGGLRELGEVQSVATEQAAQLKEREAVFREQEAAAEQEAQVIANEAANQRLAELSSAVEAVRTMQVDPQRIWSQGSKLNEAAGLVSAFVGGFLQPVLGTNTIQAVIDKAIDRDIDAQKTNIGLAQKNIGNLRMLHGLGLNQAATESEQRGQLRLMREAALLNQMDAELGRIQDPVTRQKLEVEIDKLNSRLVDRITESSRYHGAQVHREQMDKVNARLASQRVALQRRAQRFSEAEAQRRAQAEARAAVQAELDKPRAQDPLTNEVVGEYKNEKDTTGNREFDQRLTGRAQFAHDVRQLKDLARQQGAIYGGPGQKFLQSAEGRAFTSRYNGALADYIRSISGAQASEEEVQRLREAMPPPESFLTRDPDKAWNEVISRLTEQQNKDNNVTLKSGTKWDVRAAWDPPEEVTPATRSPSSQVEAIRGLGAAPEKQVQAAIDFASNLGNLDIGPGDPRVAEAIDILSGIPREQRRVPQVVGGDMVTVDPMEQLLKFEEMGTVKWRQQQRREQLRRGFSPLHLPKK